MSANVLIFVIKKKCSTFVSNVKYNRQSVQFEGKIKIFLNYKIDTRETFTMYLLSVLKLQKDIRTTLHTIILIRIRTLCGDSL